MYREVESYVALSGQQDNLIAEIGTSITQCRGSRVLCNTEAFRSASARFRPRLRSLEQNNMRPLHENWNLTGRMSNITGTPVIEPDQRLLRPRGTLLRLQRLVCVVCVACFGSVYNFGYTESCTQPFDVQVIVPRDPVCSGQTVTCCVQVSNPCQWAETYEFRLYLGTRLGQEILADWWRTTLPPVQFIRRTHRLPAIPAVRTCTDCRHARCSDCECESVDRIVKQQAKNARAREDRFRFGLAQPQGSSLSRLRFLLVLNWFFKVRPASLLWLDQTTLRMFKTKSK